MKKKIITAISLIVALSLVFCCSCKNAEEAETQTDATAAITTTAVREAETANRADPKSTIGKGQYTCFIEYTGKDGELKSFKFASDDKNLGDALYSSGIIQGTKSETGIYIDSVFTEKADYSKDKAYWAFYINGKYADKGESQINIENDAIYSFVYTIDK